MSILFNRAQAINMFAISLGHGPTAVIGVIDQNKLGTILVYVEENGYTSELELFENGGSNIRKAYVS